MSLNRKIAKRQAGASVPQPADQTGNDLNVVEAEEKEAILSTEAPAMEKNKEQKERMIKHRSRPQTRSSSIHFVVEVILPLKCVELIIRQSHDMAPQTSPLIPFYSVFFILCMFNLFLIESVN